MQTVSLFVLLLVCILQTYANQDDYVQWVKYTGEIPENAVAGGIDARNNTIYVGRTWMNNNPDGEWNYTTDAKGYVSGGITAGVVSLDVILFQKPYTVTEDIEILVKVNNPTLQWRFVNYWEFPNLYATEEYHPVRIGWEYEGMEFNSTTYVGGVTVNGTNYIGKIFNSAYYWADSGYLYYAANNELQTADSYWALIYYY